MFESYEAVGQRFKKFNRPLMVSLIFFSSIEKYLFNDGEHSLGRDPDDRHNRASQASFTSPVNSSACTTFAVRTANAHAQIRIKFIVFSFGQLGCFVTLIHRFANFNLLKWYISMFRGTNNKALELQMSTVDTQYFAITLGIVGWNFAVKSVGYARKPY